MRELIDKLKEQNTLSRNEWISLIDIRSASLSDYLFIQASAVRREHYGTDVYIRGLIEFTNYCKNNCLYCGIRKDNLAIQRYRMDIPTILSCCSTGYDLGFRTFVLQGGEDGYFTLERMTALIQEIKSTYPDCAITLSVGEQSRDTYQAYFNAGASRYLLRHETYNSAHYRKLHPSNLSASHRQQCLRQLKEIGFQTGTGFMVGSPGQTSAHLAEDMLFIQELNPQMVGIGPFIPHHDTVFHQEPSGSLELTLFMLGLLRLMLPRILLPATTALGTIHPWGRELGILAGANVVMPNLSPQTVRKNYALYDNKIATREEAAEGIAALRSRIEDIGFHIVTARGDSLNTG